MKLLVSGSTGLVGDACVEFFSRKGWEAIGIDSNMRHQFYGTPSKIADRQIDIRDYEQLETLFKEHTFDSIIHAAAQPSHDYATDHVFEDFEVNTRGTLNLLELTRKYCPEAVFVYVSTDKVYGENMGGIDYLEESTRYTPQSYVFRERGWKESMGLDFAGKRSLFGCSKVAADLYVQEYGNYFGMKTACFRPGCITGKNHEGAEQHGFLAYLTKCVKNEQVYKIFGFKGKQVRDQIHAQDLASAFYEFIKNPKKGAVYNIGGGIERSVSVLEALELVSTQLGKVPKIGFHDQRKGDRQWDVHDVTKFRKDYPEWDYTYDLKDIINDLVPYVPPTYEA